MVEVDFSGNFLNADKCKAGDIGTFVDEGEMREKSANGKTWNQLVITVDINGEQLAHSFRSSEGKKFQDLHGKETKNWVGKQFRTVFIPWVDKNDNNTIKQNVEIVPLETSAPRPETGPTEVASMQA